MKPNNNWNLNAFEQMYQHFNGCLLTAFQIDNNKQIMLPENFNDAYFFNKIEFRNAWEIEFHDMAKIALEPNDNPYIPKDKQDTDLIYKVIEELKNNQHKELCQTNNLPRP